MRKLLLVLCLAAGFATAASAQPLIFHASTSGQQTLDRGEGGGNPFASSLIEILGRPETRLAELPDALRVLTVKKSSGAQTPDVPSAVSPKDWRLVPPQSGEKRIALVLVVSDYGRSVQNCFPAPSMMPAALLLPWLGPDLLRRPPSIWISAVCEKG